MNKFITVFGISLMGLGLVLKVNNLYPTVQLTQKFENYYETIDTVQLGTFKLGNEIDSILISIDSSDHYLRDDSMVIDTLYASCWISDSTNWMIRTTNGKLTSVVRLIDGKEIPDEFDTYYNHN